MPGKGTTGSGRLTGAPRATGPEEARRSTQAHQRGTPPGTTKGHGQLPSNRGHRVPRTQTVRTTLNEPRHAKRFQATQLPSGWTSARPAANPAPANYGTAAVRMDHCAPGRVPNPYRLRARRRPDGGVCDRRVPSSCRLRIPAIRMDESAPRSYGPHSRVAQDTAQTTLHTERAHR